MLDNGISIILLLDGADSESPKSSKARDDGPRLPYLESRSSFFLFHRQINSETLETWIAR